MVTSRVRNWSVGIVLAVAVIVAAWFGLERLVHNKVRDRLEEQALHLGARATGYALTTSLWDGSVVITDLRFDTITRGHQDRFTIVGTVDTIVVHDIHWFRTLTSGLCLIGSVDVRGHDLRLMKHDTTDHSSSTRKKSKALIDLKSLIVEQLNVKLDNSAYIDTSNTRVERAAKHIVIATTGLHVPMKKESGDHAGWSQLSATVLGFHQEAPDGYLIELDEMNFSGQNSTMDLHGIRFGPHEELATYGAKVEREKDVFAGHVDTLHFSGFNLTDVDLDHVALGGSLRISSGAVTVLRDKRRPDPPFAVKPLIAGLIREFEEGQGLDTIRISNVDITYLEHAEKGHGFAHVPISSLQALVIGMRSLPDAVVQVEAQATLFGSTPVTLSIEAPATDSVEQFTMIAHIGRLAFRSLDPALRPLTGLSSNEGHMDTLIIRMSADSRNGHGSIAMAYDDLRVRSIDKDMKGSAVTAALGLLRRSHREVDGRVETVSFDVTRRRDRAIFNYLWSGMREGVKNTVMPGLLNTTEKN